MTTGKARSTKTYFGSLLASVALGVFLVVMLFAFTNIDLSVAWRLLTTVRLDTFLVIAILVAFNTFLAGEKWRLIADRIGREDGPTMPRLHYFAFTSIGVALGQVMPASLSLVASRSIGAYLYGGRPLIRSTSATVFDYFFDVLVAAGFGVSSILVLIAGGGAVTWLLCSVAISVVGLLLYGTGTRAVARATLGLRGHSGCQRGLRFVAAHSPLFAPEIGRLLLAISALRFAVLVLISEITARAIGLQVSTWQLAAALPFAIVANALAITPGGLGLTEWSVSSALFALGASFQTSAQWALTTRIVVAGGAALGGLAGFLIVLGTARAMRSRRAE
jgi:uncharacterized membrane protein YbhN (UPF0104 family)